MPNGEQVCRAGHLLDAANTVVEYHGMYVQRRCRECYNARRRKLPAETVRVFVVYRPQRFWVEWWGLRPDWHRPARRTA